jgi:hypothetical protein
MRHSILSVMTDRTLVPLCDEGAAGRLHVGYNAPREQDRARADTDFKVSLKNEVNIETPLRKLSEVRAELQRGGYS